MGVRKPIKVAPLPRRTFGSRGKITSAKKLSPSNDATLRASFVFARVTRQQ